MRRAVRAAALVILVFALPLGGRAHAEDFIIGGDATNVDDGGNSSSTNQDSSGGSGDVVAGQVGGFVAGPNSDISTDATNNSTDVSAESGDADAHATAAGFAGQNVSSGTAIQAADVLNIGQAVNVQPATTAGACRRHSWRHPATPSPAR